MGGHRREGRAQELTHQGDDEGKAVQQPVQDFGGASGLVSEDAVNQQGCGDGGGVGFHLGPRRSELRACPSTTRNHREDEAPRGPLAWSPGTTTPSCRGSYVQAVSV